MHHATAAGSRQPDARLAQDTAARLHRFLAPLLSALDRSLDARLVRTLLASVIAILSLRHRQHGLLLSELGGYLLSPAQAPAGTKRLSNLLRSPRWQAAMINDWLWAQATTHIHALRAHGQPAFAVWDESVLEKAESVATPDLCAVRSSKAARLKRIKPGFFNPPGGRPICVPGLHWLGLLVLGRRGAPQVAAMQWWTTRGEHATDRRTQEQQLLARCARAWGQQVIHLFDRGFASGPWLIALAAVNARFILRWKNGQKLLDAWGEERKAWEIGRGKRTWGVRWLRDSHTGQTRKVGVLALQVTHPQQARPLWLVIARQGTGHEPWYLLTSERVETEGAAWEIVLAYARRWQIEQAWRYGKSELAMESPRVQGWERRERLLGLVTLAYAFLLSLLQDRLAELRTQLLQRWCHRTGKRSRETSAPLYRLRSALSRLWLAYRPSPLPVLANSG